MRRKLSSCHQGDRQCDSSMNAHRRRHRPQIFRFTRAQPPRGAEGKQHARKHGDCVLDATPEICPLPRSRLAIHRRAFSMLGACDPHALCLRRTRGASLSHLACCLPRLQWSLF